MVSSAPAVTRRVALFLALMRNEWDAWFAWKLYDTLFTVLLVLALKYASKGSRQTLQSWYDFLGWE